MKIITLIQFCLVILLVVPANSLISGKTKSCGCFQLETRRLNCKSNLRHGHATNGRDTPTHMTWRCMKNRCLNPRSPDFNRYGGTGVTVCDRWKNSFVNFLEDMGLRPDGKTIDRINPYGDYEPGNCRWATPLEQIHNRRK